MADGAVPDGARAVAIDVARDAGAVLRERLGRERDVQFKGTIDLVTDADRAAEALIAGRLRETYPDHRLLGEEGARGSAEVEGQEGEASPYGWVIDPLDGTTNYAHGYPHFAVSIALERAGTLLLGVVYDPMRDELFVAERGQGASLNGIPLRVTGTDALIGSLLATGFPYDQAVRAEAAAIWNAFLFLTQGVRRDGSAALNLCYVAAGRLDGFYERPLQPWDMGAGALMVEEAGGRVSDFRGGVFDLYGHEAIASNGALHETILSVIHEQISGAAVE
ncbi:MAG: inositol monophosphatase [Chloroflexota bacterium]|nr:inositol monophosphatase [Chloroflexota bacterium]